LTRSSGRSFTLALSTPHAELGLQTEQHRGPVGQHLQHHPGRVDRRHS
jgi:hypothetical protein